jgi:hypothetical protein
LTSHTKPLNIFTVVIPIANRANEAKAFSSMWQCGIFVETVSNYQKFKKMRK